MFHFSCSPLPLASYDRASRSHRRICCKIHFEFVGVSSTSCDDQSSCFLTSEMILLRKLLLTIISLNDVKQSVAGLINHHKVKGSLCVFHSASISRVPQLQSDYLEALIAFNWSLIECGMRRCSCAINVSTMSLTARSTNGGFFHKVRRWLLHSYSARCYK